MATLNRFPLFGLWNRVAAEALGYDPDEARSIGHGVAVLFAIRARGGGRKAKAEKDRSDPATEPKEALETDDLTFGGDPLPCEFGGDGRLVRCLVGARTSGDPAQTPESYDAAVEAKIPDEYLGPLRSAMGALLATYPQSDLQSRMLYQVYDEWKRDCAAGRRVDLDQLVGWLEERTRDRGSPG